jgi:hypothetical protein
MDTFHISRVEGHGMYSRMIFVPKLRSFLNLTGVCWTRSSLPLGLTCVSIIGDLVFWPISRDGMVK